MLIFYLLESSSEGVRGCGNQVELPLAVGERTDPTLLKGTSRSPIDRWNSPSMRCTASTLPRDAGELDQRVCELVGIERRHRILILRLLGEQSREVVEILGEGRQGGGAAIRAGARVRSDAVDGGHVALLPLYGDVHAAIGG